MVFLLPELMSLRTPKAWDPKRLPLGMSLGGNPVFSFLWIAAGQKPLAKTGRGGRKKVVKLFIMGTVCPLRLLCCYVIFMAFYKIINHLLAGWTRKESGKKAAA